jgi:hypothetical protein
VCLQWVGYLGSMPGQSMRDCGNRGKTKWHCDRFLGSFAKQFPESDCSLHVPPSARMEQLGYHWTDFDETIFELFSNICRENSNLIKIR